MDARTHEGPWLSYLLTSCASSTYSGRTFHRARSAARTCTHLSCAVIPNVDEGVFECPCHDGFFDLRTGRNIAGPPPRPLARIVLEVEGDDVFAVAVEQRTVSL